MATQQARTVHVPLCLTDDEVSRLASTVELYGKIFDVYGRWFVDNTTTNTTRAHHALYAQQRELYPNMPTALVQAARNRASSCVKSYNSRNKNKRYAKPPVFTARSMSYPKTAVSLNSQGKLTFSLAYGARAKTQVNIPKFFTDRYGDWGFQSAYIGIDRNGKPFANLVFTKELPGKKSNGNVVGVDRGIYNIYATSTGEVKNSRKIRGMKRRYRHNKSRLQRKVAQGSRSAARRLHAQRGKEARFTRNENHIMTKDLAHKEHLPTYVLEDLTGVRKRSRSRKLNSMLSSWSFAQFQRMLEYKCAAQGIDVVYVDPRYTSQRCSKCGHTDKGNRQSALFHCLHCGYTAHADLNAADNIRDKYLSTLPGNQQPGVWQGVSQSPDDALSHVGN